MADPPDLVRVVGAAIIEGNRCLVARRGSGMSMAGRWEFPGGKVEPRESPAAALVREIQEELGVEISIGERLGRGEARAGAKRIQLDVFASTLESGSITPREHSEIRWATAGELHDFEWADADVPTLPAIRARLLSDPSRERCSGTTAFLSADWGKKPSKRAAYSATPSHDSLERWIVRREDPPRSGWDLAALIREAEATRDRTDTPVVIAIDAALGLPTAFGRQTGRPDFRTALEWLRASNGFEEGRTSPGRWSHEHPFFRVPAGQGGLRKIIDAAGGTNVVLRQIEILTGAKPVFALSGIPGTVGSGSRALWKELGQSPGCDVALWPFDGCLSDLTSTPRVVLGESYPLAAYATALSDTLPTRPRRIAKSKGEARMAAIDELLQQSWLGDHGVELHDQRNAEANEDDFDAMMTALALVRLQAEARALSHELVDPVFEGGILGTGGCRLA